MSSDSRLLDEEACSSFCGSNKKRAPRIFLAGESGGKEAARREAPSSLPSIIPQRRPAGGDRSIASGGGERRPKPPSPPCSSPSLPPLNTQLSCEREVVVAGWRERQWRSGQSEGERDGGKRHCCCRCCRCRLLLLLPCFSNQAKQKQPPRVFPWTTSRARLSFSERGRGRALAAQGQRDGRRRAQHCAAGVGERRRVAYHSWERQKSKKKEVKKKQNSRWHLHSRLLVFFFLSRRR